MSSAGSRRPTPRVIALSGPVAAGKSTLASALEVEYGADRLRTQRLLRSIAEQRGTSLPSTRGALQDFGDALDQESGGAWLAPWSTNVDEEEKNYVISLESHGRGEDGVTYGPYFDDRFANLLDYVEKGCQ